MMNPVGRLFWSPPALSHIATTSGGCVGSLTSEAEGGEGGRRGQESFVGDL